MCLGEYVLGTPKLQCRRRCSSNSPSIIILPAMYITEHGIRSKQPWPILYIYHPAVQLTEGFRETPRLLDGMPLLPPVVELLLS
jgi:hypothetical protein